MNILICGETQELRAQWGNFFSNSLPTSNILICPQEIDSHKLHQVLVTCDIVICLTGHFDDVFLQTAQRANDLHVPILCVANDINEIAFEKLIQAGIKGILNSDMASLDSIKTAIRILQDGGIYIDSPVKNKSQFPKVITKIDDRPTLDLREWKVFSLTTKGLSAIDIADFLNESTCTIERIQQNITAKTSCETLPEAVASGLSKGWFQI